jgi:hypothetical protein
LLQNLSRRFAPQGGKSSGGGSPLGLISPLITSVLGNALGIGANKVTPLDFDDFDDVAPGDSVSGGSSSSSSYSGSSSSSNDASSGFDDDDSF